MKIPKVKYLTKFSSLSFFPNIGVVIVHKFFPTRLHIPKYLFFNLKRDKIEGNEIIGVIFYALGCLFRSRGSVKIAVFCKICYIQQQILKTHLCVPEYLFINFEQGKIKGNDIMIFLSNWDNFFIRGWFIRVRKFEKKNFYALNT